MVIFDVALFRQTFPAFADETLFPDATLQAYFDTATCFIANEDNPCLSNDCLLYGLNLMTAHLCFISQNAASGNTVGLVTGASIKNVSVSLTPPPFGSSQWSYWLSLTPYGLQLQALLSASVAGGLYVGGSPERSGFRKAFGVFGPGGNV